MAKREPIRKHCPKCGRLVGLRSNGQLAAHNSSVAFRVSCSGRLNVLMPRARIEIDRQKSEIT